MRNTIQIDEPQRPHEIRKRTMRRMRLRQRGNGVEEPVRIVAERARKIAWTTRQADNDRQQHRLNPQDDI